MEQLTQDVYYNKVQHYVFEHISDIRTDDIKNQILALVK